MLSHADRELRKGRITSSTAAAALGLSSWMSPLEAWAEIVDPYDEGTDVDDDEQEDEEMLAHHERGHFLEPALMEWAKHRVQSAMHVDLDVVRPRTRVHRQHEWIADSADGLLEIRDQELDATVAALEAKTIAGGLSQWGEPETDQVPAYVSIQCRWHMLVHDVPVCYVPMLGPRLALSLYVVRRDAAIEEALVDTLGAWHEVHVIGGVQPAATGADEKVLKRLFPRQRAGELPDDPAIAMLVRQDVELRQRLKVDGEARSAVRAEIMDRLRDAEGCRGDGYSVTWKAGKDRTSIDYRALVEALAPGHELVEAHTRVRPGARVLRTTWNPKEDA
jgi:predicted phage-related endonuclease